MQQVPPTPLPPKPLLALAGCWNLHLGEHPSLVGPLAEILPTLPLFPTPEQWSELATLGLPIQLTTHGHHVLRDNGPNGDHHGLMEFLLAPVFVRDLCGRVIHTGLLPLPTPPNTPTFPATCADVPASMSGAEYLENAIFSHCLLLESRPSDSHTPLSASIPSHQLQAGYAHPGRYPYKIRPQTFYADGWRLPQLNRVFARRVAGADDAAAALLHHWASRPAGQDYEAFYEAIGGSAKIEELFLQGVTLIPTFEAYNGAFQVAPDYKLQGVEAGRAVEGLHAVVGKENNSLPFGTILRVLKPGFVTTTQVSPAEVIISNGPSLTPTDALLPNLALPHPHVAAEWGACWLPNQPQHFAAPALWDWQVDGRFMQTSGPLWCPTHYVYGSTGALVQAFRRPLADCPSLYRLSPTLKEAFAPVTETLRYDTLNTRTQTERAANSAHADSPLFGSALDALPLSTAIAPIGYHALPRSWPTLAQSAHLPNASSTPACPTELATKLAPLAAPLAHDESKHHVVATEPLRALMEACETYADPHLPDWLPTLPNSQLQLNVKRLFANRTYRAALTFTHGKLPEALYRFKESALAWRRLRYRLVGKYPAAWLEAEHKHLTLSAVEGLCSVLPEQAHVRAREQLLSQSLLTKVPARMPEMAAAPLRSSAKPVKLKADKTKARQPKL